MSDPMTNNNRSSSNNKKKECGTQQQEEDALQQATALQTMLQSSAQQCQASVDKILGSIQTVLSNKNTHNDVVQCLQTILSNVQTAVEQQENESRHQWFEMNPGSVFDEAVAVAEKTQLVFRELAEQTRKQLLDASEKGNLAVVKCLVDDIGVGVRAPPRTEPFGKVGGDERYFRRKGKRQCLCVSPLQKACAFGHFEVAKYLAKKGGVHAIEDACILKGDAFTAPRMALYQGHDDIAEYLIENYEFDLCKSRLLTEALEGKSHKMAKLLLDKCAYPNWISSGKRRREKFLPIATKALADLFENGEESVNDTDIDECVGLINLLLEHGADPENDPLNGYCPFRELFACPCSDELMVKILKKLTARKCSDTPLTIACGNGARTGVVEKLLEDDAVDINARNQHGNNAFLLACRAQNISLMNLLLQKNSDTTVVNKNGDNAFTICFFIPIHDRVCPVLSLLVESRVPGIDQINNSGDSALLLACGFESRSVLHLLLDSGAKTDGDQGGKAMFEAVRSRRIGFVKALLAKPTVNLDFVASDGDCALSVSFGRPDTRSIRRLKQLLAPRGAKTDGDQGGKDTRWLKLLIRRGAKTDGYQGGKALKKAVEYQNYSAVKLLLEQDAHNIDFVDECDGKSALSVAIKTRQPKMLRLLLDRGANVSGEHGRNMLFAACESDNLDSVYHILGAMCAQGDLFELLTGQVSANNTRKRKREQNDTR